jgi:hypothetical protein
MKTYEYHDLNPKEYAAQSIIPMMTADENDDVASVIICTGIAGGACYTDGMPEFLTLRRKDFKNGIEYKSEYVLRAKKGSNHEKEK